MHASEPLTIDVAGHALLLCPERAVFDPDSATLFVADAHLGKEAVFHARGVPVPRGVSASTLSRLDSLLRQHPARRLVFLGDLLHAREAHSPEILDAMRAWRDAHAALEIVLISGNHDRHAGVPPASLGIAVHDEPWLIGPWACCHYPMQTPGYYSLAGHEHPVFTVRAGADAVRLACFHFGADVGVLPAFGDFTGGHPVRRARQRIFVIAEDRVLAVPVRQGPRRERLSAEIAETLDLPRRDL